MDEIKEFCNEIKAVEYFGNNESALKKLEVEYKIFGTWEAAWDAAQGAARNAARYAARNAAWNAAQDAVREAAWKAARDAARCAAWDVARYAARKADGKAAWDVAWNAAWDAALQCCMTTVCKDLDIPQEHRDYTNQEWEIWKTGYGVLGKVEDVFYIYEKP